MANMKIGTRLRCAFALLTLLLLATALLGVLRLSSLELRMRDVIDDKYPKTVLANDIIKNVNIIARSSRNLLLMSEPQQLAQERARIARAGAETEKELAQLEKVVLSPQGRQLMVAVKQAGDAFNGGRDKVLALLQEGARDTAASLLLGTVRGEQLRYMAALESLITHQHDLMEEAAAQVDAEYATARNMLLALSALAVLFSLVTAWLVTRSIVKPLHYALSVAQTVAAGDLTSTFGRHGGDETGKLLDALSIMNGNLLEIVQQVRSGTDTIATASSQIAAGNIDLSSRTEEQASSLEQTASAMEELSSTVQQNADNARHASVLAIEAANIAAAGGQAVGQVIHTMDAISASSAQIADIIGVIDMLDVLDLPHVNRLLVLNAGCHGDTLDDVLTAFKTDGSQQAILSKVDEAVKLGPAIDALIRHQMVLRGVTNGQRVPEDWERANAHQLISASMRSPAKSAFDPKATDLNFFFSHSPDTVTEGGLVDA